MPREPTRSKLFTPTYCAMIALGLFNCLFGQSSLATIPVLMDNRGVSEAAAAVINMLFPLAALFFRTYTDTGEQSIVLPEAQAAAAMSAQGVQGSELLLAYEDSGTSELLQAEWIAIQNP